jgi:Bacteriophage head to tail connecting protein
MDSDRAAKLRTELDARLQALEMDRLSWWEHWRELAEYILPRRYRWLATTQRTRRGSQINQKIINSTGTIAARNAAAGIMSGTTSPSRPWFRMSVPNPDVMADADVQDWCDEVTKRMQRVMAGSNYYGAKAVQYLDLVVFGTGPMLIYEDSKNVIKCFNPCAGEYYVDVGPNFEPNTLYRKYEMTAAQIVAEFGVKNVSMAVRQAYNTPAGRTKPFIVGHSIEPNVSYTSDYRAGPDPAGLPRHFQYREVYWLPGQGENSILRMQGYLDCPFSCPRWDVTGNDPYGRSPGMDALGDIKQLQLEEKRKAQAIDKQVNPPMVADASMKNEPASLLPGAITYVPQLNGGVGFKPAFTVTPQIAELKEDIAEVEKRIKDAFFNDLFLMISNLDTVRSATEIDARREEKLVMIGPAMDRLQREGLASDVNRIFQIMARAGLLPPPPDAMRGYPVKVEYISLLADLQRATQTSSIERVWGFAGNIGAAVPAVIDNLDADETIRIYADLMRVPPKILTTKTAKAQIRNARDQQVQQQTQLQVGAEAVNAGKVLSETDIGGGQNALAAMLNGAA